MSAAGPVTTEVAAGQVETEMTDGLVPLERVEKLLERYTLYMTIATSHCDHRGCMYLRVPVTEFPALFAALHFDGIVSVAEERIRHIRPVRVIKDDDDAPPYHRLKLYDLHSGMLRWEYKAEDEDEDDEVTLPIHVKIRRIIDASYVRSDDV